MFKVLNIVYAMIIFLSISFSITNSFKMFCRYDEDCPPRMCRLPQVPQCNEFICDCGMPVYKPYQNKYIKK
ncbi:putative Late nodulin [Medicago truncatula]|uniref:Nodule Cysteine-Rich (NCR) secreted peptide n=1 Tax=Medicago truncatula TaxID=3880 RepID=A0A072V8K9_MEDTR|nr:Nodule Cysteine-Rich (NCR) secreted peptide [Medicago truncatula]RHN74143.1 putative Late nodulin [Medicago truncatula]